MGLVLLLLIVHVTIILSYREKFCFYLKIGFIKINLMRFLHGKSKIKQTILHLSDSFEKKEQTQKKQEKKKQKKEEDEEQQPLSQKISGIKDLVFSIVKLFAKYIKIRFAEIIIIVGGKEAAEIAVNYGIYNAVAAALYGGLSQVRNFSFCEKKLLVKAEFLSRKTTAQIDIRFSIYIWQILVCAIKTAVIYMKSVNSKVIERKD